MTANRIAHRPSGSMCIACENVLRSCFDLPFSAMPMLKHDRDGTTVVRCTEFGHAKEKGK